MAVRHSCCAHPHRDSKRTSMRKLLLYTTTVYTTNTSTTSTTSNYYCYYITAIIAWWRTWRRSGTASSTPSSTWKGKRALLWLQLIYADILMYICIVHICYYVYIQYFIAITVLIVIYYIYAQTSTMSDTARSDVATTERTQRTGTHCFFSFYYYCIITDPCLYVYMYVSIL